jgi:ABC-type polysaccharide/polyol phosphate export permease
LVQVLVVLAAAALVFKVPFMGSLPLLLSVTLLFTVVCLALGFTMSTLVKSQVQSMQMSMFYLMPSILLSGFAFPYRGMPVVVQWIAEILPPTHYIRLVRGIMLKGWDWRHTLPGAALPGYGCLIAGHFHPLWQDGDFHCPVPGQVARGQRRKVFGPDCFQPFAALEIALDPVGLGLGAVDQA